MPSLTRCVFYSIDHEVNVVDLSQSGCDVNNIKEKKTAREWDPRTKKQTAREWDPRTQEQTAREWDPRTQEQTARDWDPRTHESLVMVDSGASVNVVPNGLGTPNWKSQMMQLVSEEQTENRSRNMERDRSG